MKRTRHWMKIPIQQLNFPNLLQIKCSQIDLTNADAIGELMDSAYRDTIDYEGENLDQCIQEMKDTINGKYGPFISNSSFVATFEGRAVSAILITEWKGHPLVAFTMTDKSFWGKGLAKYLLGRSISSLVDSKWKELFLVVTEGNIEAEKLYEKVGFKKAGVASPGTPPPIS